MMFSSVVRRDIKLCMKLFPKGFSTKVSWDIATSVCIERVPVVSPPLSDIQKRYNDMLYTLEIEKSLKSDHELRHENDKIQAELLKNDAADVDMDAISKITAQDFEDAANEELAKFKFAAVETEADKKGDKCTPHRCLQRHLVLVTDVQLGQDKKKLLPQGLWKEGETLRQTAERILLEQCGPELKVKFLSNAPCGFYKYKYPSEINGKVGSKVFFYYASYKSGNVTSNVKANWLTRNELTEVLPVRYNKSVHEFLIDETF
ncbi:large ribosomal subunit protein mL46 [Achroia grisella]|uniref:large ribosomal subunit protein mL46 n=1 Tax=Achroia grisella TaxID=688607 RepID=UPI0027D2912F|nr:large ribosomal subunit protein mL46 [Achroia grisella]